MALQGRVAPGSVELLEETIVSSGTASITYDGIFDNDKFACFPVTIDLQF